MQGRTLILATLLIALAVPALPHAGAAATPGRLATFGDTGTSATTSQNVNGALADGAAGYLGLGDYEYSASVTQWSSIFDPLTTQAAYMARGNHDDANALAAYFSQGTTWSRSWNGARIVGIDTEQRMDVGSSQYNAVRSALCNAPESTRVVVMHKPWWLLAGATHPGIEFPGSPAAMDQMVVDCKVTLVLAGHEHNYQRMVRNGVSYAIVGVGGESLYPIAGIPPNTLASCSCYGRLELDLSAGGYSARFLTSAGAQRDAFTGGSPVATPATPPPTPIPAPAPQPQPAPAPGVTFTPKNGNEWWVQVTVAGATVARVDSMDDGGPWVPLTLRSWGDWAASYHVEPGHRVTYRATLADGTQATSCAYLHPTGGCAAPAPPLTTTSGFTATFSHARGNAWWVEVDVAPSASGMDARVNGGAWQAIGKTAWGSWARSIYAPAGSTVQFQAHAADGATSLSPTYAWPP